MEKINDTGIPPAYGTGLILGKFLPFHKGHQFLIETAKRLCRKLIILVGTLEKEPIPGVVRHQWVAAANPDAQVLHLTDENPQLPEEHPDFWNIWRKSIRRLVPEGPDVVFSSEAYGEKLAEILGAVHEPVDMARDRFPISGSRIRENPYAFWRYLPRVVRPYFLKRVVVTGAESTGKTTLAKELAKAYKTLWLPEYGREYVDRMKNRPKPEYIPPIARGHIAREEALALEANRILFCDTDLMVTEILSTHYFGFCPGWISIAAEKRKYDLYILTSPDIPYEPEAFQRENETVRDQMDGLYEMELKKRNLPFVRVKGTLTDRIHTAKAAIDPLIKTRETGTERIYGTL